MVYSPGTYTRRSSPLNSPFCSGDSLQKNKVQELHKPFTEEGSTSIKDDAIVHAFGPERRGRVRGLGFVLEDAIGSTVAWAIHFISFDFE
ncbi:hypothetical protein ACSBR2_000631 [Camellia fascicularis]